MRKPRQSTAARRRLNAFLRSAKRKKAVKKRDAGLYRHALTMAAHAKAHQRRYKKPPKRGRAFYESVERRPPFSDTIKFLASNPHTFSSRTNINQTDGHLFVPKTFSLVDNYAESFVFLKKLFYALYNQKVREVKIDYQFCMRIDVDASICMDYMVNEFVRRINFCLVRRIEIYPSSIIPVNYSHADVERTLYSIGAFRNIKGVEKEFKNQIALPVLWTDNQNPKVWEESEVHQTKIVEYIKRCLDKLNRELTSEAEAELYKVLGEIMNNAEEHGTMRYRFAIGLFEEIEADGEHFGTFNFSILNFGRTIYETFKEDPRVKPEIIAQMTSLSEDFTKKGFFRPAEFEEETLWTLYALQEGVTCTGDWRGNGAVQFIENFFRLKGDMQDDSISKMTILSGNTRITFDGKYQITTRTNEKGKKYKMMTFNNSGDIASVPDKSCVTFAPHFFPGTLISARILIKDLNTKSSYGND